MDALRSRPAATDCTWDARCAQQRVLVLGAGGALGRELVQALLAAGHPAARLWLFARRARTLLWRGERFAVEALGSTLPAAELAFLCTPPALARTLAPALAANGTRVIDLSGGLRRSEHAALALAEVNGAELGAFTDQLALPLATSALIAPLLVLLERAVGLAEVDLFAVVSAATGGARAMGALRHEFVARAKAGGAPARAGAAWVGNLRPAEGAFEGLADLATELVEELRTLLARTDLFFDVHALVGDLERVDCFALKLLLHAPLAPEDAAELFASCPALTLEPDGAGPVAALCAGDARVHVGRIRAGSRGPRSLCFSAAGDQLRAGSSYAALRVASRLVAGL